MQAVHVILLTSVCASSHTINHPPAIALQLVPRTRCRISAVQRQINSQVDLVDDLEMSWQQALEQADLPLLKRFWENGVAYYQLCRISLDVLGVGKDLGCDLPGLGVGDLLLVDENTHKLWDGQGRVRVVHYRGQIEAM